jgi:flagellar M-ring protein FliF
VQGLVEFVKTLGATRIAAMAAVAVALIGFFAFIILRVTAPQMAVLYSDLAIEDSSAVIKELERQAIPYTARNEGTLILVPKDMVTRLRMKMAESNIPRGGGVGYEIFDKSDALGATSFVQNINHLRALEGELSRTIRAIDRVQSARVHLVLPERPLFSREKAEPSASIVLKLRGSLDSQQVRAIRHLVASAVNGLKPTRVSVVDENGRLLADGADDSAGLSLGADERKVAFERRLREQVEQIVSSVVGPGRARVQLTAEFDFNRITQTSDRYDPEGRVVRSSQTREESAQSADGRDNQVTVGNELPNAQRQQPDGQTQKQDQSRKSEEIVNYEISRTTKTEVIEGGRVNRISVAVLVDGVYSRNDQGQVAYAPRDPAEIDRIAALVRSAIGFDPKRGDQVEVVNLRLAEAPAAASGGAASDLMERLAFTKDDIMRGIEMVVMLLLGLVVLFFVVRPLVRRIITPDNPVKELAPEAAPALVPAAAGPALPGVEQVALTNHASTMIDMAQVHGQVHAQTVQKVGELADRNPHETVAIIRQWLHETP